MGGLFSRAAVDDWFKDVRLCFKFDSNGDIKQCGNGTAKEICTKLNNYSPVYYDHTDKRKGGCEMQWKISIKNPELVPSWFANTKLCYNFKVNVREALPQGVDHQMWLCERVHASVSGRHHLQELRTLHRELHPMGNHRCFGLNRNSMYKQKEHQLDKQS